MEFINLDTKEALGKILASHIKTSKTNLRKGKTLTTKHIALLLESGVEKTSTVKPSTDELIENEAAKELSKAFNNQMSYLEPSNGRCNLYATNNGLFTVSSEKLEHFNSIDEAYFVATLASNTPVVKGQRVASIKIIPFTAKKSKIKKGIEYALCNDDMMRVHPYKELKVGLIQTYEEIDQCKATQTTIVINQHLATVQGRIAAELHCPHDTEDIAKALRSLISRGTNLLAIIGPHSTSDINDVIPKSIKRAGGKINFFGVPVDPGNLLLLGELGSHNIIVIPGCARSINRNSFNLILERVASGQKCSPQDIAKLGVGGLLGSQHPFKEDLNLYKSKEDDTHGNIDVIILAAGQSKRMGSKNKLLMDFHGQPIIRHIVNAAMDSMARDIFVVTGHDNELIENTLKPCGVKFIKNNEFEQGLSTSLIQGINALSDQSDGAIICQGDMPLITSHHINRLIAAYNPAHPKSICVPICDEKRGNPILLSHIFFDDIKLLKGDTGARELLSEHRNSITEVIMNDDAVLEDIDTLAMLEKLQGKEKLRI